MPFRIALAAATLVLLAGIVCRADPPDESKPRAANHLARESSPYLLQHAHNPVDWYPWGPEAFAKAKKEGKLVFLSIGYSSCHWCHVMERESFSKEDVAKLMNEHFVCIKVDREERPEIDHIYMTALNVQGQRGGWPLSMFLTADGKPIAGGTYWPPEDRVIDGETIRGFKSLLKVVAEIQKEKPKDIQEQADRLATATADALAGAGRGVALVELNRELVSGAIDELKQSFDPDHGGFGSRARKFQGTKFPTPPYLHLLQSEGERTKAADVPDMVKVTLDHMARGGIYDHLGGGFHRYSTERTWTVPHFEKMLYDNAQLVEVYAHAFRLTKAPAARRVVKETLAFVARELTSPDGAFYSALDADADGEEGRFYVWTGAEIDAVLTGSGDADLFKRVYAADGQPNFEGKYHILLLPESLAARAKEMKLTEEQLEARLAPLRQKLLEARAKRPRPALDTKVLTAWNGQMIAAYATAGRLLQEPKYVATANQAADFVLQNLRTKEGRLQRTYGAAPGQQAAARLTAYLDDYAFLVHGLLALREATGEAKRLEEARSLTDRMVQWHADEKNGGFFYTSHDHEKLFARAKDHYDGAQPSGNSVAAANLVRLWRLTGEQRYRALAEKTFKAFATELKSNPSGLTTMAEALANLLEK
jgi:uncharacterized protein YyaL (SSP411 family)